MIKSVNLRNFKCFEEENIGLGGMTLVTGLNSTGKSSLIQSLLLLRQSRHQRLLQEGLLALNGELVELGRGRDILNEAAQQNVISLGLTWNDGLSAGWDFNYNIATDVLSTQSFSVTAAILERPPFSNGNFHYLSAERIGPRAQFGMDDHEVQHLRQLGPRGEYASYFLSVFGAEPIAMTSLAHKDAATGALADQVEAWLGEISPGVRMHLAPYDTIDAVELRYSFAGPHGSTNRYRATNVGFGLTYTLPILVAVLSLRPGSLLIIENPEAHLHPRGQIRLTGLLARAAAAGVQVLVETHSDHVLNGLRLAVHGGILAPESACIHYFERRVTDELIYHTYSSPKIDADGRLDQWPDGFFDDWERSLGQLLGPGKGVS